MRASPALLGLFMATMAATASGEPTVSHLFTDEDPVVAEVDGRPILLSEVEEPLRAQVMRTLFDLDRKLAAAVEQRVLEAMLEAEAAAAGMTSESWIEWKVDAQVWPVTVPEARQHYRQSGYPGDIPFQRVREQMIAELTAQRRAAAHEQVLADLRQRHGVVTYVAPFRIEVSTDDDPALGPPGAPVTIVEFSDFQCPYCARARTTLKQVMERYPERVRWVARDFPLPMHPMAEPMAQAAQCATEQGAYWRYADAVFDRYRSLDAEALTPLAAELGLEPGAFRACLQSGRYADEVQRDMADGQAAGVTGTPSFFINGIMLSGAQPLERFVEVIERELAAP